MSEPTPAPARKSLKDFNYFDENRQPTPEALLSDATTPLDPDRIKEHRKTGRKLALQLGLSMAALVAVTWFIAGYRGWITYAFSSSREPLKLGDVTSMRPEEIPHNAFVQLHGITEHRGLRQKEVRGLSIGRKEYWYFRLLGSRGVFIGVEGGETPRPTAWFRRSRSRAGPWIRPEDCCDKILATYRERFYPREEGQLRFILVGAEPGDGWFPFVLLFLLYGAVWVSVGLAARRAWRHAAHKRLAGLPVGLPQR